MPHRPTAFAFHFLVLVQDKISFLREGAGLMVSLSNVYRRMGDVGMILAIRLALTLFLIVKVGFETGLWTAGCLLLILVGNEIFSQTIKSMNKNYIEICGNIQSLATNGADLARSVQDLLKQIEALEAEIDSKPPSTTVN